MLEQLKRIFGAEPVATGVLATREPVELATAALLIEMTRSDFSESATEKEAVRHLLQRRFILDEAALDRLIAEAARRADTAVSLHEFTHRLNRELPEADKLAILEMLWRVSNADGHIDKHEEYLIQRVAGLLHISDRDRVRLKLKVVVGGSS
jgi:uncharacterized tellurite resistance protein B-like protein